MSAPEEARAVQAGCNRVLKDRLSGVKQRRLLPDLTTPRLAPTQEARRQLRAQHEAAAALCHKVGMRG